MAFFIGAEVRMQCALTDYNNGPTSGTVTCEVKDPSGNIASAVTSVAYPGTYYAFIVVDESGTWYYRFESTGTTIAASEASFVVNPTQFP